MKTYPEYIEENKLHSFEVARFKVSRNRAARIVEAIPGVKIIRKPKRFFSWFREEVFCEFEFNGYHYQIDEPFGDNSRF